MISHPSNNANVNKDVEILEHQESKNSQNYYTPKVLAFKGTKQKILRNVIKHTRNF